jgi:hypothetical protein
MNLSSDNMKTIYLSLQNEHSNFINEMNDVERIFQFMIGYNFIKLFFELKGNLSLDLEELNDINF